MNLHIHCAAPETDCRVGGGGGGVIHGSQDAPGGPDQVAAHSGSLERHSVNRNR